MNRGFEYFLLILALLILTPAEVSCQEKARIVVLPFTGREFSQVDLDALTLLFEESLLNVESLQVIDQVKREKVLAFLDPALLKCDDVECALKAGKALSADTVVLGTITKAGEKLVVSTMLIDVKLGKSIKASSAESESKTDLPRTVQILLWTMLQAPAASPASVQVVMSEQEKLQRLKALESLRADLKATIAGIEEQRAPARTWAWVFVGVGAVSAGLSGVCAYMAEQFYQDYQSTSVPSQVAFYHQQVLLWDTLTVVSAGTGLLSIGVSIPFFLRGPSNRAEKQELKRIETEISSLQSAQGETR